MKSTYEKAAEAARMKSTPKKRKKKKVNPITEGPKKKKRGVN